MAILSAFNMIRCLSIFHLTIAYYLLTSPSVIVQQTIVLILGESMQMPQASSFDTASPATAFLAVLFAFLGLSDLTAASMSTAACYHYWSSQTPIRLVFLFALTAYIYLINPSTLKLSSVDPALHLKNGLLFTWSFMETATWFLVFLSIRDERQHLRFEKRE